MINEGQVDGDSFLHRADPRAKLLCAVALSVTVATVQNFIGAAIGLVAALLLFLLSGVRLRDLLRKLLPVNFFLLFLWAVVPLTYGGEALTQWGPLEVSRQGVLLSALVSLKCNAVLMAFICLLTTSPVPELGRGMEALGMSDKLCALLLFSYRYIFVIGEEYQRLRRAATMRGFRPSTGMHTYRTYAYLVGMTLVRSHARAQRVRQAMALRCFDGRFRGLRSFHWRVSDGVLVGMLVCCSLAVAATAVLPRFIG